MIEHEDVKTAESAAGLAAKISKQILGPRIDFIKDSRYASSISKHVESKAFSDHLEDYQERLFLRVSQFSSLAFSEHPLSIDKEYEPLFLAEYRWGLPYFKGMDAALMNTFRAAGVETSTLFNSEENLIDGRNEPGNRSRPKMMQRPKKSALVVDGAGMGKSTYLKYLATSILTEEKEVPVFVDLRQVDFSAELEETISKELGLSGAADYIELTRSLLRENKIVLLLDGFDEILQERQVDAASKIGELSKSYPKAQIVVTSRPQNVLPKLTNFDALCLAPFTKFQAKSLLKRYDVFVDKDYSNSIVAEFDSIPEAFLSNPLSLSLIFFLYAINRKISTEASEFYSQLYEALFEGHDLKNKSNYVREKSSGLTMSDFRTVLRAFSAQSVNEGAFAFTRKEECINSISRAAHLCSKVLFDPVAVFDDLCRAVPFVKRDGTQYVFIHRTIVEYFAAEYIASSPDRDRLIVDSVARDNVDVFGVTVNFLKSMIPEVVDRKIRNHVCSEVSQKFECVPTGLNAVRTLNYLYGSIIGVFCDGEQAKQILSLRDAAPDKDSLLQPVPKRIKFSDLSLTSRTEISIDGVTLQLSIGCVHGKPPYDALYYEDLFLDHDEPLLAKNTASQTCELSSLVPNMMYVLDEESHLLICHIPEYIKLVTSLINQMGRDPKPSLFENRIPSGGTCLSYKNAIENVDIEIARQAGDGGAIVL